MKSLFDDDFCKSEISFRKSRISIEESYVIMDTEMTFPLKILLLHNRLNLASLVVGIY